MTITTTSLHRALTLCVGLACGALGVALLSAQATVSPSSVVVRVASLPATCTTGQVVIVMTGSVALNVCTATDTWTAAGVGTGAPTDATYITKTANSSLSAEQALGALATGVLKSTTTTGVLSIATAADLPVAGADTQVLFNNAGAFGGNANLTVQGGALLVGAQAAGLTTVTAGSLYMGNSTYNEGDSPTFSFWQTQTPASDLLTSDGRVQFGLDYEPSVDAYGSNVLDIYATYGGGHHFTGIGTEFRKLGIIGTGTTIDDWARLDYMGLRVDKGTTVADLSIRYIGAPTTSFGTGSAPVVTKFFVDWIGDYSGLGTNGYAYWYDSPGVFRIKNDGVMAYYNPAFTKYAPGAANFERFAQQWTSNVAEYGVQAGGTGTLRVLRLLGASIQAQDGASNYVSVTASDFIVSGTSIKPLRGTSASLGGSALLAGACATNATTVTGVTTAMAVAVSPVTYPGAGATWDGYVSGADTVTTRVCGIIGLTPTASTYNIAVIP